MIGEKTLINTGDANVDGFVGALARWREDLRRISGDLRLLTQSTESEILDLGARLHQIHSRAGELAAMSGEIVSLASGERVNEATVGLNRVVARISSYMDHEGLRGGESASKLGNINELLGTISNPLENFGKINKTLRMLGISTKIESARLGQAAAGFDTLADDVTALSVQVNDKTSEIRGQKDRLAVLISRTLGSIAHLEQEQHGKAISTLEKVQSSLDSLDKVNAKCHLAAESISSASDNVWRSISEVVTSMQFHDITRQQIEHVFEAFDHICQMLENVADKPASADSAKEVMLEVGDICELQLAQMRHAGEEFSGAVQSIIDNLRAISGKEADLSREMKSMAGIADQTGRSFFTEMEGDITRVTGILGESATTNRQLAESVSSVAGTIADISSFVGDIETIGEEIELIALNAQIKAARTGTDGAALGVLAEAIQKLAVDARLQTETVLAILKNITENTSLLCDGFTERTTDINNEVGEVIGELKELLLSLSSINERMSELIGVMDSSVNVLNSEIDVAIQGITVHQSISATLERLAPAVRAILDESRRLAPVSGRRTPARTLSKLTSSYTMESERNVHASVFNVKKDGAGAAGAGKPVSSGDGDLGDNVELF